MAWAAVRFKVVVLLLLIHYFMYLTFLWGICVGLCCALLCVLSSIAIILTRKRELVALL